MYDLSIKNGQVYVYDEGLKFVNIAVKDGLIAKIGEEDFEANEVIDAEGKIVAPGAIDPHTHFGIYNSWGKDFYSESRAAAMGGITTVINYFRAKDSYLDIMPELIEKASNNSIIDFGIHLGILTEQHVNELSSYIKEFGVSSYKIYTNYMGRVKEIFKADDSLNLDDGDLDFVLRKSAKDGLNIRFCVHCENMEISRRLSKLYDEDQEATLAFHDKLSPDYAETESVLSTLYLAKKAGAKVYIVHVSSGSTVEALTNNPSFLESDSIIETCPHYLAQNVESEAGLKAKVNPPIRTQNDSDVIWEGIRNGLVTTIGSDHCNLSLEKKGSGEYKDFKPGFGGLALNYPILLDEGYNKRNIEIEKIIKMTSENAAKSFNLFPKKGCIKEGADADICILDLEKEQTVDYAKLASTSDFSIYQGRKLKGWPICTISNGNVIMQNGEIVSKNASGKYLMR